MSELLTVTSHSNGRSLLTAYLVPPGSERAPGTVAARPDEPRRDRVDLSDEAHEFGRDDALADVREDLVRRVRASIARDDYPSPEMLDVVVERLHAELTH